MTGQQRAFTITGMDLSGYMVKDAPRAIELVPMFGGNEIKAA